MSILTFVRESGKQLAVKSIMSSQALRDMARLMKPLDSTDLAHAIPIPFSLLPPKASTAIRSQAAEACGVRGAAIHDIFPCTALQEGFIGVSLRDPRANIARHVFELGPRIEEDRLKAAWQTTVSSIEMLRTRFFMSASLGLLQTVVNEPAVITKGHSMEHSDNSFQPGRPMVQASISANDSDDIQQQYLILKLHHTILDLFTLRLIIKTLQATYNGRLQPALLPFQVAIAERKDATTVAENQKF
ncbi:hypothetical protein LQW54_010832 [Pestalotiopsis sp. IQ-011]